MTRWAFGGVTALCLLSSVASGQEAVIESSGEQTHGSAPDHILLPPSVSLTNAGGQLTNFEVRRAVDLGDAVKVRSLGGSVAEQVEALRNKARAEMNARAIDFLNRFSSPPENSRIISVVMSGSDTRDSSTQPTSGERLIWVTPDDRLLGAISLNLSSISDYIAQPSLDELPRAGG